MQEMSHRHSRELDIFYNEHKDRSKADITYPGSTIHAEINADGYVTKAVYTINLHLDGAGNSGPIKGTAVIEGAEVETWILNW